MPERSQGSSWAEGEFRRREILIGGGLTLAWLAVGSWIPSSAQAGTLTLSAAESQTYSALVEAVFDDGLGVLGVAAVVDRFVAVLAGWDEDWQGQTKEDLVVLERAWQQPFSTLTVAQRRSFLATAGYDPRVPAVQLSGDAGLIPVVVVAAVDLARAPEQDDLLDELVDLLQAPLLDAGDTDLDLYLYPDEG